MSKPICYSIYYNNKIVKNICNLHYAQHSAGLCSDLYHRYTTIPLIYVE